jgi:hypothetical protein
MWLCMNDGFLSVVEAPYAGEGMLAVRARMRSHIEDSFPGAEIIETPDRDYQFRALLPKDEVAKSIARKIAGIDYRNFKDSVRSKPLSIAYSDVWSTMLGYAEGQGGKSAYIFNETSGYLHDDIIPIGTGVQVIRRGSRRGSRR